MHQRLFLGIHTPESVNKKLVTFVEHVKSTVNLNKSVKWVRPENYHITVSFFGNVEEADIPALTQSIAQVTQNHQLINFNFESITFESHMMWAAFRSLTFSDFANAINSNVRLNSVSKPHEPRPHITLARFKHLPELKNNNFPEIKLADFEAEKVYLFRSQLHPKGSIYTPLQEFSLS